MTFKENIKEKNVQKRIDKLVKKYKNKKILIYGAGLFSNFLFKNYNFSKLNIVGVVDKKFKNANNKTFYNYRGFSPDEVVNLNYDVVLIANADYKYFLSIVKENFNKNTQFDYIATIKGTEKSLILRLFYSYYCLVNPKFAALKLRRFIMQFILPFVRNKDKRVELFRKLSTLIYGAQVLMIAKSVGKNFCCYNFSIATTNTVLKNNVFFNGMKIIGRGKVTIGRYFHSGEECFIVTQTHNYDDGTRIPYDSACVTKDVEIGDFVWFGARVTILPGTKIGEGAIIQAGAVVHGEIPPYAIAGGNPAKVFKYRDIEHFKKLKAEEMFY